MKKKGKKTVEVEIKMSDGEEERAATRSVQIFTIAAQLEVEGVEMLPLRQKPFTLVFLITHRDTQQLQSLGSFHN
jgi:hypothetical protein